MALTPTPSKDWSETIGPDEADRHSAFSDAIQTIQTRGNARYGPGRAFHREQVAAASGELSVTATDEELLQGLFSAAVSQGDSLSAVVRFSHGGIAPHADAVPDIQGFALSVRGISGPGALTRTTDRQDFLMINSPSFGFRDSADFAEIVAASAGGQAALAKHLISSRGPIEGPRELARLTASLARPFFGFAASTFYSAAPIAYGPYAAKMRLVPVGATRRVSALLDQRADLVSRLKKGPLHYDLEAQFYLSDDVTPVEDLRDPWPESSSPFHAVARLTLPQQDLESAAGEDLAREVEHDRFDPWNALADHRPLGEVMRARKVAYYPSVVNRGAAD